MDFKLELPEELALIRQTAKRIVEEKVTNRLVEFAAATAAGREFPEDVWKAVCGAGFMGAIIPEAYGGSGMGLLALTVAIEEMAAGGYFNELFVTMTMDAMCILRGGSEELKKRFLPGIADGSLKFCFALTESEAGSNAFRITTHAKRNGDRYVLNGSKTYISGADRSDHILLVARTKTLAELKREGLPKASGLSVMVVDTKSRGITMELLPITAMMGVRQYTLYFDDVEVPSENMVGEEDGGSMVLFKALNPERIVAAAGFLGGSRYCLDLACSYAKERKVFRDTPIGAYQAIQHPLAEIRMQQEAVRLVTHRAAVAFDGDIDPVSVGFLANTAKYLASDLGLKAADRAIQTLGGNGFSNDLLLPQFWMAMRLGKTIPITNELILNFVAEHMLGLPRSY
jgi:acyl-CoA dehydrogenase